MRAGPRISLTFATALRTPLPPHLDLSPSLSSHASCCPVRILALSLFALIIFYLVLPCAGSAWHNTSVETGAVDKIYFHSGIASTIVHIACVDLLDRHIDWGQKQVRQ